MVSKQDFRFCWISSHKESLDMLTLLCSGHLWSTYWSICTHPEYQLGKGGNFIFLFFESLSEFNSQKCHDNKKKRSELTVCVRRLSFSLTTLLVLPENSRSDKLALSE